MQQQATTQQVASSASAAAIHPLQLVFDEAVSRAPGTGASFMEQDWLGLAATQGPAALTDIAQVCVARAQSFKQAGCMERWEHEMLAAINGLAMAVLHGHATRAAEPSATGS